MCFFELNHGHMNQDLRTFVAKTHQSQFRYVLKEKKRYYLGIFPKRRTPPPTPPFWEPLFQKKFLVFNLHFRT